MAQSTVGCRGQHTSQGMEFLLDLKLDSNAILLATFDKNTINENIIGPTLWVPSQQVNPKLCILNTEISVKPQTGSANVTPCRRLAAAQ